MLWFQGLSEAPFPIQKCVESWRRENPGWEVILLDEKNLGDYLTPDLPEEKYLQLDLTKRSNLVRLQLLQEYGGVCTDATTYCIRPLDGWLAECTTSGFFAFCDPGRNRVMANWFLAADKGNPVVTKMRSEYTSFFQENNFNNDGRFRQKIRKLLQRTLSRNVKTARLWLSWPVTKVLRVYPYFIFHFLFERLVSTDSQCREIWAITRKIDAKPLFRCRYPENISGFPDDMKQELDERRAPLHKLNRKSDFSQYGPSSALYYLL